MRRARSAQPSLSFESPIASPPALVLPTKPGERFTCSGCGGRSLAGPSSRAISIQLGNHPTSTRIVWLACSPKCAAKSIYCSSCNVYGHTHAQGPDVCPRWYSGPRNRALPLYECYSHRLVRDYQHVAKERAGTATPDEEIGRLILLHGGDIAQVRAVVEALGESASSRYRLTLERAERDNPFWGIETREFTADELRAQVDGMIVRHRRSVTRPDAAAGYPSVEQALAMLCNEQAKTSTRAHGIAAYGARASTADAVRELLPFLQHPLSEIRSPAAWALFLHRTPEVRAALEAQAVVEPVLLLKIMLEQLARTT